MTREEVIEYYKGGISIGDGITGEEWLLDEKSTSSNALYLLGYDANMDPMPDLVTRPAKYQEHVKNEILKRLEEWNGAVYLDGILIKPNILI